MNNFPLKNRVLQKHRVLQNICMAHIPPLPAGLRNEGRDIVRQDFTRFQMFIRPGARLRIVQFQKEKYPRSQLTELYQIRVVPI